ncbi:MAG: hypothetical protein ACK6BM_02110 [Cyanobacteriota bacterium]
MAYSTTKPGLNSSHSIVRVIAERIIKVLLTVLNLPILGSILIAYFLIVRIFCDSLNRDLALVNAWLAVCWTSALFVGSFLYWLIRLPDSKRDTPIPILTRNELDYLKGGIEEVFKGSLSEMSFYDNQMGMVYRTHGGDLKWSAQEALDPQSKLLALQIKGSLQGKRLVLGQLGENLRKYIFLPPLFCSLNLGLIMIIAILVYMASGLGLPTATYKNFQVHLANYTSASLYLWIWSVWVFLIGSPSNDRTRLGDAVLDFYAVYGSVPIP